MIEINDKDIDGVRQRLGAYFDNAEKLIADAMNKSGIRAKKKLPETAEAEYDIDSNSGVTPRSANIVKTTKAKPGDLHSSLIYKTGSMGLDHYRHFYGYRVNAGVHKGAMKIVKGGFVPRNNRGNYSFIHWKTKELSTVFNAQLIFKREGKERFPIKRLFSIPVGSMFETDEVEQDFDNISWDEYEKALEAGIKATLRKAARSSKQ